MTKQCKKSTIFHSFHAQTFSAINNVTFTRKEIDVIACILNGRGTKTTGILLSISPKTVEVHTRNIMLKIGCNSRESIISFMEKSSRLIDIKKHYFNILVQNDFVSNLRKISKVVEEIPISCHMIFWPEYEEKNSYVYRLKEDLTALGIAIHSIERVTSNTLKKVLPKSCIGGNDYILYCIPNITNNSNNNITSLILKDVNLFDNNFNNLDKLSYLSANNLYFNSINTKSTVDRGIEFGQDGYYQAFYKLVNQINPSLSVERVNYSSTPTPLESSYIHLRSQYAYKDGYSLENSLQSNLTEQLPKKQLMSRSMLAIFCLLLLFSIFQYQNEKKHLLMELKEISTQWLTLYEPDFNEAVSLASFYQMRSNALDVVKAREISTKIDKLCFELNKDLERISDKLDHNENNVWIINPLNWSLKNKIISCLEDFRKHMLIALSLNKAIKCMRDENFSGAVKEINESTEKQATQYLANQKNYPEKEKQLKALLSIIINIKSVARRKLAEDKEVTKTQYKNILKNIHNELINSINNYDSLNFNTYIVVHYITLLIAHEAKDESEKTKLEIKADNFMARAVQIAPNDPIVLATQAIHFMERKEYERALAALDTSINLNPNNVGVLHNRAELYLTIGEIHKNNEYSKKAYADAQRANALKPHDCDVLKLVVWSSIYAKGCTAAKENYNKVFKPLCIMNRKDWDDVSAIRNESDKILQSKFTQLCHTRGHF